jgi:hypothetical protein
MKGGFGDGPLLFFIKNFKGWKKGMLYEERGIQVLCNIVKLMCIMW